MSALGALRRRLQSDLHYLRYVYGSIFKIVGGVIAALVGFGVLSTFVSDAGQRTVAIILGAVTVVTLGIDMWRTAQQWKGTRFSLRPPTEATACVAQWDAPGQTCVITSAQPEHQRTRIWLDRDVDSELWQRSGLGAQGRVTGELHYEPYSLPPALARRAPAALRKAALLGDRRGTSRRAHGWRKLPVRFNGHLVRLSSEPTPQQLRSGELQFQHVRYFDGESSNEVYRLNVAQDGRERPFADHFAHDRSGRLRSLDNAQMANIVGISIFAVTTDGNVLLVRQTMKNSVAPGAVASSGSGSLDWRDYKAVTSSGEPTGWAKRLGQSVLKAVRLRRPDAAAADPTTFDAVQLLRTGMLRELREETKVRTGEIDPRSAVLTGYFRWMSRGAKPEFTGLVPLLCDSSFLSDERRKSEEHGESAFTQKAFVIPVDALFSAARTWEGAEADIGQEEFQRAWDASASCLVSALDAVDEPSQMSPSCEATWVAAARYLASRNIADLETFHRELGGVAVGADVE